MNSLSPRHPSGLKGNYRIVGKVQSESLNGDELAEAGSPIFRDDGFDYRLGGMNF